ncbi:MAG: hypothetical protein WBD10_02555 [Acidobacteriaceae bacterium]
MKFIGKDSVLRIMAVLVALAATPLALWAGQATVHVAPPDLHGPRPLATQTATAVVRDYMQSWSAMKAALEQNRAGLLDPDFVGAARDKLAATIREQAKAGIRTRYQDRSHDLKIIFYSPEGLSIQLVDNVQYDQQVIHDGKVLATEPMRARYIVVLTPSEVRWKVRIFQAQPE